MAQLTTPLPTLIVENLTEDVQLGNCDFRSDTNYLVYFKWNQYE